MKKAFIGILSTCLGLSAIAPLAMGNSLKASPVPETTTYNEVEPRALTALVIDIYPAPDGQIRAQVQNTFTLFPTTVSVALYVFTSPTYTTDITQMTQENYAYIHDLDMGQTLTIDTPTNGEKKYWMAYMWYQCGTDSRKSGHSDVKLFNADGSIPPY